MPKNHHILLTDAEWETLYAVYPQGIPVIHPALAEFARLSKDPQELINGTQVYREQAWKCRCWMCDHMLALPVITGFHLYVALLNQITAGGNPRYQLN